MVEPEQPDGAGGGEISLLSHELRDRIVIEVSGEVDLATAGTMEQELLRAEESHGVIVLDLSETSFMDSTGIHVIVSADQRMRERGARLILVDGPPQVRRLFELTGVADHVEFVRDAAEVDRAFAVMADPASPSSEPAAH